MSKIIFSKPKVNSDSIIKSFLNLKMIALITVITTSIYLALKYSRNLKPIVWAFIIIISIQILFKIIVALRTNVYHVEMDSNRITLKYHVWNSDRQVTWPISLTKIDLLEKRNGRGFFDGIQIQFKNDGQKLKLKENIWDYVEFENIYFEFKKIKNESVPEDETDTLKQLQIMTGKYKR